MATPTKLSLKLLIDKKANRVLFAEANKDFIDFLFSLMSIPVGSMIRLLTKQKMVGCGLGDLYESIENLSDAYVQPNQSKDVILKPKSAASSGANIPLLITSEGDNVGKYYMCASYHRNVTDIRGAICPNCSGLMTYEVPYVGLGGANNANPSNGEGGGYVKGVVTYMVMDNLVVTPMSTISSITLLNKFSVQDVGALEERMVDFAMDKGLELLKASLLSRTVLSDVFLAKKK